MPFCCPTSGVKRDFTRGGNYVVSIAGVALCPSINGIMNFLNDYGSEFVDPYSRRQ